MTFNLDELREAEALLGKMAQHAEKISPVLAMLREQGDKALLTQPLDRFVQCGEVRKMLKISTSNINKLIRDGKLTPVLIANSSNRKFRLSEVERLMSPQKE